MPRLLAPLVIVLSVGCAGPKRSAQHPDAKEQGAAQRVTAGVDAASDPIAELARAEQALEQDRAAEAVALFGRVLAARGLDEDAERRAYLGLAHAHEQLLDCAAVIRAYDAYLERFPQASDKVVVDAHRGACQAELGQWEASAKSFAAVAVADGQLPSTRIEALARQGFALFNLERFEDADRVLARADEIFERAEKDRTERFSSYYFVGMARFYRAAIVHRRFHDVTIVLPEKVMAERFKQKLELLVAAQDAYNHTIKSKHMFWVSASGYQLGNLFGEFYDAMMYAPVPDWLDERQRVIYYEELKKQIRPVIDKAVWVLEKNLETARRLGYESEFIARTEVKLSHLQSALDSDEPGLGKPLTRLADDPDAGGELAPPSVPAEGGPEAAAAVDRKLFVPPMTPLAP